MWNTEEGIILVVFALANLGGGNCRVAKKRVAKLSCSEIVDLGLASFLPTCCKLRRASVTATADSRSQDASLGQCMATYIVPSLYRIQICICILTTPNS